MAKLLLKLAISCGLLVLLLWRVPLGEIGNHLRSFGSITLLLVLVLSLICWVVAAIRLWCLLPEFRFSNLLHATFVARFYSTVLPGQIAGDVIKAYRLGLQSDRSGHAEAATALDRVLGLFALFLVSAVASVYSTRLPLALRLFFVFGTIGIIMGGLIINSPVYRTRVVGRLLPRRRGRVGIFVRDFGIALQDHMRKPITLAAAVILGLLFHAGCVAMQVLLGQALGMRLRWEDWTVVYAGVSLLMLLPISVAGLGLREGGYVGLLALFGYKTSAALSLSFAILGASLVAALVGGFMELATVVNRFRLTRQSADRSTKL